MTGQFNSRLAHSCGRAQTKETSWSTSLRARVTDIIYAQLSQDADLYNEIMEICRRENIKTGYVINVVGGLRKARLSMPVKSDSNDAPPGVREWEGGLIECQAIGIIGQTLATYDSEKISGIINSAGAPYMEINATITVRGNGVDMVST